VTRQINAAGLALLKDFEKLVLTASDDGYGTPTMGYGHTGKDVKLGMTITPAIADALLAEDLVIPQATVARNVTVPINDNQFSALVCFAFNEGSGSFLSSTLLKNLNAGWYGSVPAQLARWNKAKVDGVERVSSGLTRRRAAESALWNTPCATGAEPGDA
jgi:lysozyme